MENKAHAFVAGAFVLALVAATIALVVWFTRDNTVRNLYELSTDDPVSGLQPQAMVRYRGIAVGKVTSIDFDPSVRGNVRVRITVDERVPLTQSSYATLSYQGVTGLAFIALDDDGDSRVPLHPNNSEPPRIPLKPSTFAMLQERGEAILQKVDETAQRVNALVDTPNQQRIASALENIAQAAASANQLTQQLDRTIKTQLNPALAAIPPLAAHTSDTLGGVKTAAANVSRAASTMQDAVGRLNGPNGALERLTTSTQGLGQAIDAFNGGTLPRINRVADETSHTVRRLGRAAENLSDNPQSLLYGNASAAPGPGEPGFAVPSSRP